MLWLNICGRWDAGKLSALPGQVLLTGSPVLVHLRRDILVSDKAFRTKLAQSAMGSFRVGMLPPIFLTRANPWPPATYAGGHKYVDFSPGSEQLFARPVKTALFTRRLKSIYFSR